MKEGYVKATNITLQTSPQDRLLRFEQEAEVIARRAPTAKKGPLAAKELLEVKEIARKRLEDETNRIESSGFVSTNPPCPPQPRLNLNTLEKRSKSQKIRL